MRPQTRARIVRLLETGGTPEEIAGLAFYHSATVRRVRRSEREARMVAMAELASLHPEEYNDLVQRHLDVWTDRSVGRARLGGEADRARLAS